MTACLTEQSQALAATVGLVCSICLDICTDVRETTICGHLFCNDCICDWLDRGNICPLCKAPLSAADVRPSVAWQRVANNLTVKCTFADRKCEWTGVRSDIAKHLSASCKFCCHVCTKPSDQTPCSACKPPQLWRGFRGPDVLGKTLPPPQRVLSQSQQDGIDMAFSAGFLSLSAYATFAPFALPLERQAPTRAELSPTAEEKDDVNMIMNHLITTTEAAVVAYHETGNVVDAILYLMDRGAEERARQAEVKQPPPSSIVTERRRIQEYEVLQQQLLAQERAVAATAQDETFSAVAMLFGCPAGCNCATCSV